MPSETKAQHDEASHRFYIPLETGEEAILEYRREKETLDFYHTYVPEESRGRGLAQKLVTAGFLYAKEHHLRVIPTCPYISQTFLRRHKQFLPFVKGS